MSEFSESYHLKSNNQTDAVSLLKKASLSGHVLPQHNGWVSFVVKESQFEPIDKLISSNQGQLIHYIYAEDHGWEISIYFDSKRVFNYRCDWEDEISVDDNGLSMDLIKELSMQEVSDEQLGEIFYPNDFDGIFDNPPAYKIAEILGLKHYEWVSYDYVNSDLETGETGMELTLKDIIRVG